MGDLLYLQGGDGEGHHALREQHHSPLDMVHEGGQAGEQLHHSLTFRMDVERDDLDAVLLAVQLRHLVVLPHDLPILF